MSTAHQAFEDATHRHIMMRSHHDRLIPLAAAIIAVLAALGALFAHHRSISALSVKNEAILFQAKASDQYNYYEAKRVKYAVYTALLSAGAFKNDADRNKMQATANHEQTSSLDILGRAQTLERQAAQEQERSESILRSFETLEIATTLFDISIVLVSISALSETRIMLYLGCGLSAIGVVFLTIGYLQAH